MLKYLRIGVPILVLLGLVVSLFVDSKELLYSIAAICFVYAGILIVTVRRTLKGKSLMILPPLVIGFLLLLIAK